MPVPEPDKPKSRFPENREPEPSKPVMKPDQNPKALVRFPENRLSDEKLVVQPFNDNIRDYEVCIASLPVSTNAHIGSAVPWEFKGRFKILVSR